MCRNLGYKVFNLMLANLPIQTIHSRHPARRKYIEYYTFLDIKRSDFPAHFQPLARPIPRQTKPSLEHLSIEDFLCNAQLSQTSTFLKNIKPHF